MKRCTFFKAFDDVMALSLAIVVTFAGLSAILLLLYVFYKFVMAQ